MNGTLLGTCDICGKKKQVNVATYVCKSCTKKGSR